MSQAPVTVPAVVQEGIRAAADRSLDPEARIAGLMRAAAAIAPDDSGADVRRWMVLSTLDAVVATLDKFSPTLGQEIAWRP